MSLDEYRVGLVVPQCGLNARQLVEVTRRLREVAAALAEGGQLLVRVPGFAEDGDGHGVPAQVLNLRRLAKVRLETYGLRSRDGGTAGRIVTDMERDFRADEVWCCPEQTHVGASRARTNVVHRIGQLTARPGKYKRIPPWVEPADGNTATAKTTKKGARR